jgi:hypothetical protein
MTTLISLAVDATKALWLLYSIRKTIKYSSSELSRVIREVQIFRDQIQHFENVTNKDLEHFITRRSVRGIKKQGKSVMRELNAFLVRFEDIQNTTATYLVRWRAGFRWLQDRRQVLSLLSSLNSMTCAMNLCTSLTTIDKFQRRCDSLVEQINQLRARLETQQGNDQLVQELNEEMAQLNQEMNWLYKQM